VPETAKIGPQSLTTADGIDVVVSSVITFSISDVKKFLLEIEGAEQVIEDVVLGYMNEFIRSKTWEQLKNSDINTRLTTFAKKRAEDFGVDILRIQVTDFTQCISIRHLIPGGGHNTFKIT